MSAACQWMRGGQARSWLKSVVLYLLLAALGGCDTLEEAFLGDFGATEADELWLDASASAEDLYFEVVRLHSTGLLSAKRMEALQEALDDVDRRYQGAEHDKQTRAIIASTLRRTFHELRQGEDGELIQGYAGRAYAQALHRAGVREAERYAEGTVFIAGMLGVPTSRQDAALLVAAPVAGYIVVKLGGMALKRAAFLLRRSQDADAVVEHAKRFGFQVRYAADRDELRHLAGEAAIEAVENAPAHVGAAGGRPGGKYNPWNPLAKNDNCSACVASVIRNSLKGYFEHSADELERLFEHAGRERRFNIEASLRYVERATGLRRFPKPVSMLGGRAPVGHYAVFTRWRDGTYRHVMYGRVTPTGRVAIFDPQTMEHLSYEEMLKRNGGKALPYLLEAP